MGRGLTTALFALASQPATLTHAQPTEQTPVERVRIDGLVAVVDRKVITRSECEAEARLALLQKGGAVAAAGPIDGKLLRAMRDHLIVEELLLTEARQRNLFVAESAVEAAVLRTETALRDAFGEDQAALEAAAAFRRTHGIDQELLRGRARRELLVQTVVAVQMDSSSSPPTSDERQRVVAALVERLRQTVDVRVVDGD